MCSDCIQSVHNALKLDTLRGREEKKVKSNVLLCMGSYIELRKLIKMNKTAVKRHVFTCDLEIIQEYHFRVSPIRTKSYKDLEKMW